MNGTGIEFEHILVNNASLDNTLEVLTSLKSEFQHVRVLDNEFNIGAFKSMQRGISVARGELIVPFLASDCQDPPELIKTMLEIRLNLKCDTVAGIRKVRHDNFLITLFRKLFYKIIYIATRGKYRAGSSEFRLMLTSRAKRLAEIRDATPFLRIYMAQLQGDIQYIEYEMAERTAGVSSASFFPLVDDALNGITLAAPSLFSRLLIFSLALFGASSVGLCVLILLEFLQGPPVSKLMLPVIGLLGITGVISIQAWIGHYIFLIHSQLRSGPTATTQEL
jgi:glycosyltransferase involved in cell wall biosynthesis